VPIGQSSVGPPHDTLQFPELGKEAWSFIVDFRGVECDYRWSARSEILESLSLR
jgi:hypothetical protein